MKEIFYDKDNKFLLTDGEFAKAVVAWNEKKSFWCQRTEKLLTPYYKFAGTKKDEIGFTIYLKLTDGNGLVKIYERNNKYYKLLSSGDGNSSYNEIKNIKVDELILQEDFYGEKNNLRLLK